jgi:hypothetical protein
LPPGGALFLCGQAGKKKRKKAKKSLPHSLLKIRHKIQAELGETQQ